MINKEVKEDSSGEEIQHLFELCFINGYYNFQYFQNQ